MATQLLVMQVNKRLAEQEKTGLAGDPAYPKQLWPPKQLCSLCYAPTLTPQVSCNNACCGLCQLFACVLEIMLITQPRLQLKCSTSCIGLLCLHVPETVLSPTGQAHR